MQHLDDVDLRGSHPGLTLGAGDEVVLDPPRARVLHATVVFFLFLVWEFPDIPGCEGNLRRERISPPPLTAPGAVVADVLPDVLLEEGVLDSIVVQLRPLR